MQRGRGRPTVLQHTKTIIVITVKVLNNIINTLCAKSTTLYIYL